MAETVKKSRIVSDNEDNLEEALMEEFNMRLKKCMSQDDLQQDPFERGHYEPLGSQTNNHIINEQFIRAEQRNYFENEKQNGYHQPTETTEENNQPDGVVITYENVVHQTDKTDSLITNRKMDQYIDMTIKSPDIADEDRTLPNEDIYEDIDDDGDRNRPDLTLTDLCDDVSGHQPEVETRSVKDRMLLSTEMAPCLLFTQTVTSPMLTPSEENIDFLKGFRRESTEATSIEGKENGHWLGEGGGEQVMLAENVYENSEFLSKHGQQEDNIIYENLKQVEENIYENLKGSVEEVVKEEEDVIYQNVEELRKEAKMYGRGDSDQLAVMMDSNETVSNDVTDEKEERKENDDEKKKPATEHTVFSDVNFEEMKSEKSTQVTQSYVETTTVESHGLSGQGLKKKKSKKSRKEEKENISVNGTTNNTYEDTFYNVDVKNLCRSFGDLTKIGTSGNKCIDQRSLKNVTERAKSSFSKFDALQKKNVLHVRSSDSSKAQEKFNGAQIDNSNCRACEKAVFQMEQIKAEKAIWHKNCFRCKECNKQLNVDTYQSNEGTLYCKPHFKTLFAPKAVEEDALPSDKPDLGLEELQSLNVKERFQVFEHHQQSESSSEDRTLSTVNVKRSPSILSKLAKFQAKGMDIGVADDSLNGIPIEESSSEAEEEEDDIEGEDADLIRAKRVQKEKPFHFTGMLDVKNKWEHGEQQSTRDERREERKQEIQSIRNRLFMGKQGKMKEAYQQAVIESESSTHVKKEQPIEVCDTKSLKERFEKGEMVKQVNKEKDVEEEVFESEISKKSRSLFLELDANASKPPQLTPTLTPKIDVKKAREAPTPDRDVYRDPELVRSEEVVEDSVIAKETHTATKMLNKFRQMEENLTKEQQPTGPKPLKRFTPPPEPARPESRSEAETESEEEDDEEEDEPDRGKYQDEDLIEAQKAARAKQLRAKFERWEANEIKKEQNNSTVNIIEELGEEQSQIESTKTLRARFESMRESNTDMNRTPRVKVNRFVGISKITEMCESCNSKVYPLEKISVHNHIYHKNCFKCMECNCVLRMDSYSYNQGLLYCMPHFKRLFISKGNYDTGFGLDQRKEKWNATVA